MEEGSYDFTFTAPQIDLDYEFEAARYFDFTRQETVTEAREAERWFLSAATYPPSPFAAKLVPRLDLLLESHVNTSPKSKNGDMDLCESDSDGNEDGVAVMDEKVGDNYDNDMKPCPNVPDRSMETFHNHMQKIQFGLSSCNEMIKENFKAKTKSSVKPSFTRSSTLMKPTASQLAKQNKAQQICSSRFPKSLSDKNQKNSGNHSVIEVQAPKRQKIEGGHLYKVGDTTQQSNFIHKEPKKTKMRITVPREPDLATAHRAQRLRPKAGKETNDMTRTVSTFKARPLNKKILEYPSLLLPKRSTRQVPKFQEFHLRTSERATQHSSTTSSTILPCSSTKVHKFSSTMDTECGNREPRRPNPVDNPRQESCDSSHAFRYLSLKKGFNSHTEKRVDHNLPIELFDKLSLASESQASTGSQLKPARRNFSLSKGSKENKCDNVSKGQERVQDKVKEKLAWAGS